VGDETRRVGRRRDVDATSFTATAPGNCVCGCGRNIANAPALPAQATMEVFMQDKYVDAYVIPVPKSKVEEYGTFSKKIGDFVRKHGALEYVDCIADDVKPGKQTSFPQAVQLGNDEIVMLSWATYKSRADRDRAIKAMMEEPSFKDMGKTMPVDGKRMFMGGFKVVQAF
jgi:uncharacterized protein YbaA (DUF1428 family)